MSVLFTTIPAKRLAASISASALTFKLNNIKGWDAIDLVPASLGSQAYAVFRDTNGTVLELMEIDPATIASASITILRRGLKFTGDRTTEVTANKLTWVKGTTIVELGSATPQDLQYLKEYIDSLAIAGAPNATSSAKGLLEVATSAEIDADTALGSTGASISVTPDQLHASKYGIFIAAATGMVIPYAGSAAPTGFLLCDGSAVSRTTYAALFAIISTTFGAGNGSTTFNLPDLRGSAPIGAGQRTRTMTFNGATDVVVATDQIAVADTKWLITGQLVALTGAALPTGLSAQNYYVIRVDATHIKLATTLANAQNGTPVDITVVGSGTCTLTQTLTSRTLGETGGEETHAMSSTEQLAHTHNVTAWSASGSNGAKVASVSQGNNSTLISGAAETTGGNAAMNNMSPYTALNYLIKT